MNRASPLIAVALIGFVAGGIVHWQISPEQRRLSYGQPNHAAAFRHFQRLSEGYLMPENALLTALEQKSRMRLVRQYQAGVFPGSWTWLGPGNIGGRIRAILIHPTIPTTMWAGTASGGVWKTTNGGGSWFPLEDFMPCLAVGSMALDPSNPDVLYVGTGEGFAEWPEGTSNTSFIRGIGILKSTDGGQTWAHLPSTGNPDFYFVNRIALQPGDTQTMLVATSTGVWRSANSGANWTRTHSTFAYDVRFHPTNPMKAIAGLHDSGVVYSNDGGLTWTPSTGLTGHRTELAYFKGDPSIVYAGVSNSDRIRIYRSTDGGQSFALRSGGTGISTYAAYNSTLWVDPTDSNKLVFGGVYLFKSGDGGATQTQAFNTAHADMHVIVEHPQFNGVANRTVYFGTDGGVYRTTDSNGTTATSLNNNLGVTQFYGAVVHPTSGVAYGGTQDNGTLRFTGNPQAWTSGFGGDGSHAATDPTNSNYFYGAVQWANLFRSTNGGSSASYIYNSSVPITDAGGSNTNFITFFTLDPNDPNRMYVGCRRLWRSNNVKASPNSSVVWAAVKPTIQTDEPPNFPGWAHFAGNSPFNISTVAVAEGDSNLVWVGHNNGQVFKSTNGTAATPSWTRVDDDTGPMPLRWPSRIVINPNNHDDVYVSFMGWDAGNVWRTTDGGSTWAPASGTGEGALPSVPVSALALHKTEPGWLYAGTEIGLFTSVDGGANWTTDNQGPANVPIEELNWKNSTTLIAVTHGRGLYQAVIDPQFDPVSPLTFSVVTGFRGPGPLSWIYISDERRISVQADLLTSDSVFPAEILMTAKLPHTSVQSLRFTFEGGASMTGLGQTLQLYDFVSQQYVDVDDRSASLGDTVTTVSISVQPNRFVAKGTQEVRAKVRWYPRDFESTTPWSVQIDQAYWTAVR